MGGLRNRTSVKINDRLAVVNALVHVFAVITHRKHHALCHKVVFHQAHRDRIHHLAHHQARLLEGIRILQHLPLAHALRARFRLLDIGNRARFVTPRMVNQQLRIHAEHLVKRIGILDARPCDIAHRAQTAAAVQIAFFKTRRNTAAHLPKARNRLVRPEFFAVSHLVEFRNAHAVFVGFHMLRHHVHRNLAQVKIRADAACRGDSRRRENVLDNRLHQFTRRLLIQFQITCQVQKAFVYGIGVDIVGTDVFQINVVDLRGILHVFSHLRLGDNEFDVLARTALDFAHLLVHLEKAGTARNPVSLERGRHRKANCLLSTALVGHHKLCLERVQTAEDAFHRGKERLQVYGSKSPGVHDDEI